MTLYTCCICGTDFEATPYDILFYFHHSTCENTLCEECFKNWKSTLSTIGWKTLTCSLCDILINIDEIFQFLTDEEKVEYYYYQTFNIEISNDEKWLTCAYCDYKEIGDFDDIFLLCKKPSCSQLTCLICHKTISYSADNIISFKSLKSNQTSLKMMIENINEEIKIHEKCSEYSSLILKIQKQLEDSTSRKCPHCNHRGRKDEFCTHITCENCNNRWCYICLKEIDNQHNENNSKDSSLFTEFCPLYMQSIGDFRASWPCDSDVALEKFHRHLGLYQLNNLYQSLNEDEKKSFDYIGKNFPHVLNGFELSDIYHFDDYIFRE